MGNLQNGFPGSEVIGVSDFTVGPSLKYYVSEKSFFMLEGGMTALRRWEFRNDELGSNDRFIQEFDPRATWFLRAGFAIKH